MAKASTTKEEDVWRRREAEAARPARAMQKRFPHFPQMKIRVLPPSPKCRREEGRSNNNNDANDDNIMNLLGASTLLEKMLQPMIL